MRVLTRNTRARLAHSPPNPSKGAKWANSVPSRSSRCACQRSARARAPRTITYPRNSSTLLRIVSRGCVTVHSRTATLDAYERDLTCTARTWLMSRVSRRPRTDWCVVVQQQPQQQQQRSRPSIASTPRATCSPCVARCRSVACAVCAITRAHASQLRIATHATRLHRVRAQARRRRSSTADVDVRCRRRHPCYRLCAHAYSMMSTSSLLMWLLLSSSSSSS
jgi:hypothetical protein